MTEEISAGARAHLETWVQHKPVFALMGEFSAGKSTLANFLFGRALLPENVTATNLPVVWLTHSATPFTQGLRHDGTLVDVDFDGLGETVREEYLALRIGADAAILERADVVDTPGLSDPKLARGATRFLDPYLDFVLWCSSAIQAWRKTEKTAWTGFSQALWPRSLLVLTRADKVRSAQDLRKVLKRVTNETDTLFAQVLPLDTPLATEVRQRGDDNAGSEVWRSSGGEDVIAALYDKIAECAQDRRAPSDEDAEDPDAPDAVAAAPEPVPTPEVEPVEAPAPVPVAEPQLSEVKVDAPTQTPLMSPAKAADKISALKLYREARSSAGDLNSLTKAKPFLDHVKAQFEDQLMGNPTHIATLAECLTVGDQGAVDAKKLLEQVELEITDFDTEGWCSLAPTGHLDQR